MYLTDNAVNTIKKKSDWADIWARAVFLLIQLVFIIAFYVKYIISPVKKYLAWTFFIIFFFSPQL